jgi:hypothetical protein
LRQQASKYRMSNLQRPRTDPGRGFIEREALHGARLSEYLGTYVTRSGHIGADFIASNGTTYDAMGPVPSEHFNAKSFSKSLSSHLKKSVDRISIDVTGLNNAQQQAIRDDVSTRSESDQDRIDVIGLE